MYFIFIRRSMSSSIITCYFNQNRQFIATNNYIYFYIQYIICTLYNCTWYRINIFEEAHFRSNQIKQKTKKKKLAINTHI